MKIAQEVKMIQVYVRHQDHADGRLLGEFEPEHLPRLVQKFKEYPILAESEEAVFELAQFICDETGAYFEIVVEPSS